MIALLLWLFGFVFTDSFEPHEATFAIAGEPPSEVQARTCNGDVCTEWQLVGGVHRYEANGETMLEIMTSQVCDDREFVALKTGNAHRGPLFVPNQCGELTIEIGVIE